MSHQQLVLSKLFRRWTDRMRRSDSPRGLAPLRPALRVEEFEARIVPASALLPQPIVATPQTAAFLPPGLSAQNDPFGTVNEFAPVVVASPTDPTKLVSFTTQQFFKNNDINQPRNYNIVARYSTNGGTSWTQFNPAGLNSVSNPDPTGGAFGGGFNSQATPSAVFARDGSVYLTYLQFGLNNDDASSLSRTDGAVVLAKFNFSGARPVAAAGFTTGPQVIYQWVQGRDEALNPTVGIDTNLPTFTDPLSGAVQTDPTSDNKSVYVAWNTNSVSPNSNPGGFQAAAILAVGSGNGGLTFSTPEFVNSGGYFPFSIGQGSVQPQILFSPGVSGGAPAGAPAGAPGGKVVFVWSTTTTANNPPVRSGDVMVDASTPAANPIFTLTATSTGGHITDAAQVPNGNGGTFDQQSVTAFPVPVNFNTAVNGLPTDLNVNLSLSDNNVQYVSVDLYAPNPDGTAVDPATTPNAPHIRLLENLFFANSTNTRFNGNEQGPSGNYIGELTGTNYADPNYDTTFSDSAARNANDTNNGPSVSTFVQPSTFAGGGRFSTLRQFAQSLTATQLNGGQFVLAVTDYKHDEDPTKLFSFVNNFALKFSTGISSTGFGTDTVAATGAQLSAIDTIASGPPGANQDQTTNVFQGVGFGAGVSAAFDTTLGSQTSFGGRLYVAYTAATTFINNNPVDYGTIDLVSADNVDKLVAAKRALVFSSNPTQVDDDAITDNFSEGTRAQFQPSLAVDPTTGTVAVQWYDARYDASDTRFATYLATSIDGGSPGSFSPSANGGVAFQPQVFLNTPKTATNAITGATVTLEPVPTNTQILSPSANGLGNRQSLLFLPVSINGVTTRTLQSFWTGNPNEFLDFGANTPSLRTSIYTATTLYAAGPRVIVSDSGPVTATATQGSATYNNTFAADGTRQLTGFYVEFDRPVTDATDTANPSAAGYNPFLSPADFDVRFLSPDQNRGSGAGQVNLVLDQATFQAQFPDNAVAVQSVTPVDATGRRFFVAFTVPQSRVGTYSYAIDPNIRSTVRVAAVGTAPAANGTLMDQNGNGVSAEGGFGDYYATPAPKNGGLANSPFALSGPDGSNNPVPNENLQPLIIPGPYIIGTTPVGESAAVTLLNATTGVAVPSTGSSVVLNQSGTNTLDINLPQAVSPASFTPAQVLSVVTAAATNTVPAGTPQSVAATAVIPEYAPGAAQSGPTSTYRLVLAQVIPATQTTAGLTLDIALGNLIDPASFGPNQIFNIVGGGGAQPFQVTAVQSITQLGGALADPSAQSSTYRLTLQPTGAQPTLAAGTYFLAVAPPVVLPFGSYTVNLSGSLLSPASAAPVSVPAFVANGPSAVDVTFNRLIDPLSFTPDQVLTFLGPTGPLPGPFTVTPVYNTTSPTPAGTPTATFRIGFPGQVISGSYAISIGVGVRAAVERTLTAATTDGKTFNVVFSQNVNPFTFDTNGADAHDTDIVSVTNTTTGETTPLAAGQFTVAPLDDNSGAPQTGAGGTLAPTRRFQIVLQTAVSAGTYTINVAPNDGTANPRSANIQSAVSQNLDTNQNAGLSVLRGGNPANSGGAPFVTSQYSTATAGTPGAVIMPAGQPPAVLSLNVPDDFQIEQLFSPTPGANQLIQVTINITYPSDPDLQATLIAPDGTRIQLFSEVGAKGTANFTGTTFNDLGNTRIENGSAPFTSGLNGPYTPQLPLSQLAGHSSGGVWKLEVVNAGSSSGTIDSFTLFLPHVVVGTDLGEPVADRGTASFRVFNQDPSQVASTVTYTPVGGASQTASGNPQANAGRVTAIAIDPSDPSGNTAFIGGASGGVWKTTNFLTQDPAGPSYVPLTGTSGNLGLNIASISLVPRNNDTNQTIVFALTGEGNQLEFDNGHTAPGLGVLRSLDGGKTWAILDSTNNTDQIAITNNTGNILPVDAPPPSAASGMVGRDRLFFGATGFKITVDPTPVATPGGGLDYIVYMAVSDPANPAAAGVWRSNTSGRTWVRVQAGPATDVVLAPGSAASETNQGNTAGSGNLSILYAAFRGQGVFFTSQAPDAGSLTQLGGGQGNGQIEDISDPSNTNPNVNPTPGTNTFPTGNLGRISLAVPALTGSPVQDSFYTGWVYAYVSGADGNSTNGLYMTKDFGANWTKVNLPNALVAPNNGVFIDGYGTNNETRKNVDALFGGDLGDAAITLTVNPNNPSVVYIAGIQTIRVDVTKIDDPEAFVFYDEHQAGVSGTASEEQNTSLTSGGATPADVRNQGTRGYLLAPPTNSNPNLTFLFGDYLNLRRNPTDPFNTNSNVQVENTKSFLNSGFNVQWGDFSGFEGGSDYVNTLVSFVDPLTGQARLIAGTSQGVYTGVDRGDGTLVTPGETDLGFSSSTTFSRNGNLQLGQDYAGAAQPSQFAADLAGALFYTTTDKNGLPVSNPDLLANGNITSLSEGNPEGFNLGGPISLEVGQGIATNQTGVLSGQSSSAYEYRVPYGGPGAPGSDSDSPFSYTARAFFRGLTIGQGALQGPTGPGQGLTQGLLTGADNPGIDLGQFQGAARGGIVPVAGATGSTGYFAVNPIDPAGILITSRTGNLYRTTNGGNQWFLIGGPSDTGTGVSSSAQLDGNPARALAFGAPAVGASPGQLDDFIYDGTTNGDVFISFNAGGSYRNVPIGNGDTSAVMQIVANPNRNTFNAFAVTQNGVYFLQDARTSTTWVPITGNIFQLNKAILGDPNNSNTTARSSEDNALQLGGITSLAVDWRYVIPVDPTNPSLGNYPVVYVGGFGGVFRTTNALSLASTSAGTGPTGQPTPPPGATWTFFPGTPDGVVDGGFLPDANVTDLDLSLGNIDPTTGFPNQANGGLNLLLVTTFGRGQFAIRLPVPADVAAFMTFNASGPQVLSVANNNPTQGPSSTLVVTFSNAVAAAKFAASATSPTNPTVILTDPNGNPVQILGVAPLAGDLTGTKFVLTFATQMAAQTRAYTLKIGPNVFDLAGDAMNQNRNAVNGQFDAKSDGLDDQFVGSVFLNTTFAPATLTVTGLGPTTAAGTPIPVTVTANNGANTNLYNGIVNVTSTAPFYIGSTLYSPGQVYQIMLPGTPQDAVTFSPSFVTTGTQTLSFNPLAGTNNSNANAPAPVTTTVVAGGVTHFAISGVNGGPVPATVPAGTPVGFTVTALDQYGNVNTAYTGPVTFTGFTDPTTTITPAGPAALAAGTGQFTVTFQRTGTESFQVVDANNAAIAGGFITTVTAGAATRLTVSPFPGTVAAGQPVAFTVTALDQFGNPSGNYTGPVAFSAPTDPRAGVTVVSPFSNGAAMYTVVFGTTGSQALRVSDPSNPGITGSTATTTVVAGAPVTFDVTGLTAQVVAGAAGTTITVTGRDGFGNITTNYTGAVTFGSSDPQATLPAGTALINGTRRLAVTFRTAGGQSVTATSGGATGSAGTTVVAAATAKFVFPDAPAQTPAGTPFTVTVVAQDPFGNSTPGYNGSVRLSSTDTQASLPPTGPLAGGTGSFTVTLRGIGNARTLTATDSKNSAIAGTSGPISVVSPTNSPPVSPPGVPPTVPPVSPPGVPPTVPPVSPPPPPAAPVAGLPPEFAVGTGTGVTAGVTVYRQDGSVLTGFQAFEPGFTGGARVAIARTPTADLVLTAAGPGRQPDVRINNLVTGATSSLTPFEVSFTGGMFVAAGDFNRDGFDDYVVSPDQGGGPRVQIHDGRTGATIADFFGIDDPNFRGGARVAVADVNGDGTPDLIVAAGFGGGPRVAIFDGKSVAAGTPTRLVPDFYAFESTLRNGAYVAAGDVTGDGKADLIFGGGPGGSGRVRMVDGAGLLAAGQIGSLDNDLGIVFNNFIVGDPHAVGGIRVAVANLDNGPYAGVVTGSGEGAGAEVTEYHGADLRTGGHTPAAQFNAEPGSNGGVFVG